MNKGKKKSFSLLICFVLLSGIYQGMAMAQSSLISSTEKQTVSKQNVSKQNETKDESIENAELFADALNAYKNKDWKTSIFLFKKLHANSNSIYNTEDTLYMLINAQTQDGQFKNAISDCDIFLRKYPDSRYVQLVKYQKGKDLYHIGNYEKSILTLSDFCHSYPSNQLYSSAIFWIAESFYATYNFDNAKPLYERIVIEYSTCAKAKDAKFRLDVITQRNREEKLLYLLKQTGEDYLSSKEAYEKAIKQSQMEKSVQENLQIKELRLQNQMLDENLTNEKKRTQELEKQLKQYETETSVKELKIKANDVLKMLDE